MRASDAKPRPDSRAAAASTAPAPRSQAEVLRGAVAGERWAHAALYDALYPIVARALQKILHHTSDYEDLVQTSFELIVRTLQKPKARDIENLAAWASAIAARVALDAIRARVRERRVFDRDVDSAELGLTHTGPRLEQAIEARRELAWLQNALGAMNAEQAEAVLLHDVLGHELKDIAKLTDVSPAAAQKRLSRAHLELKKRAEKRRKTEQP